MGGGGSLDSMNKTIQRNRALLERKTLFDNTSKRRYERPLKVTENNPRVELDDHIRIQIQNKLRLQRRRQLFISIVIFTITSIIIGIGLFIIMNTPGEKFAPNSYKNRKERHRKLHSARIVRASIGNGFEAVIEYFPHGTKSAETKYKKGFRHQNSESYYETGEQFRSAVYFYDTLITEVYFYKDGDTIADFPTIIDKEIYHLAFRKKEPARTIEFDFYDGKILQGSYRESVSTSGH